jgi:hypothetical protein
MKKFMITLVFTMSFYNTVEAKPNKYYSHTNKVYSNGDTSTAQGVAQTQADKGYCGHFGGNSGYEGVGYSQVSGDHAIRNCCYWGQKTPIDIGVARGRNGWYACVRYR